MTAPECPCETCQPKSEHMRMVLCPTCGFKRCPHATDHRNECSGSNAVGQAGSSYEHAWRPDAAQAERERMERVARSVDAVREPELPPMPSIIYAYCEGRDALPDAVRTYATQAVLADRAQREPVWCGCGDGIMPNTGAKCWVCASLVDDSEAVREAVEREREACAEIAEHLNGWGSRPCPELAHHIAAAIRARTT